MAHGGPSATSNRNKKRLIHVSLMRLLASYVQANCGGDITTLQLSGFPVQKPVRQTVGPRSVPQNLTLKQGPLNGSLAAKANPVFGASTYTWTLTPATPGAAAQTVRTTAANCMFQDLTPAQSYTVEVNAVGGPPAPAVGTNRSARSSSKPKFPKTPQSENAPIVFRRVSFSLCESLCSRPPRAKYFR
jgi:hypothetical protein